MLIFTYSLWVLYLSIAPCCWEDDLCIVDSCADTTSGHHHEPASTDYPSDARDQNCSPFVRCGNCSGFVVNLSTVSSEKTTLLAPDQANSFFVLPYWASAWLSPVWQPPQPSLLSLHS
ncbi:hypothetical protein [Tunicatimonas pelagia]|uniref:hypothetical protein n=1 Tax=Tunicatimonas pelagia TaxID=931531 RepID=UPI002666F69F|nr:hypothetical protein [Tunicatimonas pelagia]WKN44166.1 hypothetical protein P0M28_04190 [Tunicatimonas pelagia]